VKLPSKKTVITFVVLNEIRGLIMTAPIWLALIHHWAHAHG
jgi:hypothetical protein